MSGELRHWRWASTIPFQGHAFGNASGIGVDTINGLVDRTFTGADTNPAFGALVYPKGRWRLAGFGRVLTRYQLTRETGSEFFSCSGGYRDQNAQPPFCEPHAKADGIDRFFPERESIDLRITSVGGAVAYQLPRRVSVGAGVQYARFHMDATNTVFAVRGDAKFLPANFSDPANVELRLGQTGDDGAWAVNGGILWAPEDHWKFGAAFQQGPSFTFRSTATTGAGHTAGAGITFLDLPDNPFKVPDRLSAGLTFSPNPLAMGGKWLTSVEYDRIQYSQLLGKNYRTTVAAADSLEARTFAAGFRVDDANAWRAGVEYTRSSTPDPSSEIVRTRSLALRGGVFFDPQHQPYFQPADPSTGFPNPRAVLGFPKGTDQWHRSLGLGIIFEKFRVDVAGDFAPLGNTFAISAGYIFPPKS
jgi:hypothetical protein